MPSSCLPQPDMAKLLVSPAVLVGQLFIGAQPELEIRGASFDPVRRVVVLDVEGPGVPPVDGEVVVDVTVGGAGVESVVYRQV